MFFLKYYTIFFEKNPSTRRMCYLINFFIIIIIMYLVCFL